MYAKLLLQWLALGASFFIYNYLWVMLQVDSLGGLLLGSLLLGAVVTALVRLLHFVCHRAFSGGAATFFNQLEYILTFMGAFIAACCLVFVLPGYLPNKDTSKLAMLLFFTAYSFAAVWSTTKLLEGQGRDR